MKKIIIILLFFVSSLSNAAVYYVATDGNDSNNGSIGSPWLTWQHGFMQLSPGDSLYLRGGVYYSDGNGSGDGYKSGKLYLDPDDGYGSAGTSENWIYVLNYPGETPVLDCSQDSADLAGYNIGMTLINTAFWHFEGFTIRNIWQRGDSVSAWGVTSNYSANFVFKDITIHDIGGRGWWMQGGAWTEADSAYAVDVWGSTPEAATIKWQYDTTYWINCDVYNLCDTIDKAGFDNPGNSADGWKTTYYDNNLIVFQGCRAWYYSDDGFDPTNVSGALYIMDNCWAMPTTKFDSICTVLADPEHLPGQEANGIKFGTVRAEIDAPGVWLFNCLAMFCEGEDGAGVGFMFNAGTNGSCRPRVYNCTAYYNSTNYQINRFNYTYHHMLLRNNIAYQYIENNVVLRDPVVYEESNNTWDADAEFPNWVYTDTVTVTDDDFMYIDSLTLEGLFKADRDEYGNLPPFPLQIVEGSDLVDAGMLLPSSDSVSIYLAGTGYQNWQPTYNGSAPDIGAFEYGTASTPPQGSVRPASGSPSKAFIINGRPQRIAIE